MNDRRFLIPANAKRGLLIFSFFRPFDLILFGTGMLISIFGLLLFFRGFKWYILLLEIWVGTIIAQAFPLLQIVQATIALALSWYFWVRLLFIKRCPFFEIVGDQFCYLYIPTVFILAQLNYESQFSVEEENPRFYGPRIPLSKYL